MLLPVEVESVRTKLPRGTLLLLLLNIAVYALCVIQGFIISGPSMQGIEAVSDWVLDLWALTPAHPTLLSFITAQWVHLDILHLGGNLLFLWVFGTAAEEAMGTGTALGVYLVGGFASTLAQYLAAHAGGAPADIDYAGSSGAVIALIVSFAIRRYRARVRLWLIVMEISLPLGVALAAFILWYTVAPCLLSGPDGSASYWGHLAGLAAGVAMAGLFRLAPHGAADYSFEDALAKIEAGELKDGLERLQALQRLHPTESRIPLALAHAHVKIWDHAAAARYYQRALQIEIQANQACRAKEIWEEAEANRSPLSPTTALSLAALLVKTNQKDYAIQLYQWAASTGDESTSSIARRRLASLGVD